MPGSFPAGNDVHSVFSICTSAAGRAAAWVSSSRFFRWLNSTPDRAAQAQTVTNISSPTSVSFTSDDQQPHAWDLNNITSKHIEATLGDAIALLRKEKYVEEGPRPRPYPKKFSDHNQEFQGHKPFWEYPLLEEPFFYCHRYSKARSIQHLDFNHPISSRRVRSICGGQLTRKSYSEKPGRYRIIFDGHHKLIGFTEHNEVHRVRHAEMGV